MEKQGACQVRPKTPEIFNALNLKGFSSRAAGVGGNQAVARAQVGHGE
jgi:hypothetical protein